MNCAGFHSHFFCQMTIKVGKFSDWIVLQKCFPNPPVNVHLTDVHQQPHQPLEHHTLGIECKRVLSAGVD